MNKPPMPDQPKTKEIPAVVPQVPATLDAVLREVRETRHAVTAVVDQVSELNERVRQVEVSVEQSTARVNVQSLKVRGTSENDLRQDAAIAELVVRTAAIETNQGAAAKERADTAAMVKEVRDTVVGVATNKKVIFVGKVLFALAVAYSAAHGLKVVP